MIKLSNASFAIFVVFAISSSVQGATVTDKKQNNRSLRHVTMKADENDSATYRDLQTSKVESPGIIKERLNHNEDVLKIQSCVDKLQQIVGNNNKGDHYLEPIEKVENCNKLCANQALTKGLLSPKECHAKCQTTDYENFENVMKFCVKSDGELPTACDEVPGNCKCVQNCAIADDALFGESCNAYAPDGLNQGGGDNCPSDPTLVCCCATPADSCREF